MVTSSDAVVTSGINTHLTVWSSDYHYLEGWFVQLDVSVWDGNGQTIEIGDIHVNDLNGSTVVFTPVSGPVTIVLWEATTDGLVGIHVFEVAYNDASGVYNPVTTILELLIGQEINSGETGMIMELDNVVFNVAKGQIINLNGNLSSSNKAFPYFYIDEETAFLSVEANIEGNWRILGLTYPYIGISTSYEFDLRYVLPPWIPAGTIDARCTFSGSSDSNLDVITIPFIINLLPAEKTLVIISQQSTMERNNIFEKHQLPVEIQVPGFDSDPVALNVDLYDLGGPLVKNLIVNHFLDSYSSILNLDFSQDITVGNYNVTADLIDNNTRNIISSDSFIVDVVDDLLIDNFYWNITDQDVEPGQNIQGHLVAREEDTFVGVKAKLVIEIREKEQILFNSSTGDSGYIDFSFSVPEVLSRGLYNLDFRLIPLTSDYHYLNVTRTHQIILKQETSILHQENQLLIRKEEAWFNATVVDDLGLPVNEGNLSLNLNGDLIHESKGSSINYQFILPETVPRGICIVNWHYSGSYKYKASDRSFPITVYAIPTFTNLTLNATEAYPGEQIIISGKLTDEGVGVIGAMISVTHLDNWSNTSQLIITTDDQGYFSFTYTLDNEASGLHRFTLEFEGWTDEFYLPVAGKPIFEVNVLPRISLLVNGPLIAGENTTLEFIGKSEREVIVDILKNETWKELAVFNLNTQGKFSYDWYIYDLLRGKIFLRARYADGQGTALFSLEIKVKPRMDIQVDRSLVLTGEEIEILITSSENHSIFLDGYQWQSNLSPGSRYFSLFFTTTGDHDVEVVASGVNVIETVKKLELKVRDDYNVTVNMPSRGQRSTGFVVNVNITNKEFIPLEGFLIKLMINDTLMASAVTSQTGTAELKISLNTGIYEGFLNISPLDENVHFSKEIVLDSFIIYSVPIIEIPDMSPVKGRVTSVEVSVTDGLNPIEDENISFYLNNVTGDTNTLIGSDLTDNQGKAIIYWNVTQESGDYLLQVKNIGSEFLKSIIVTKAINILPNGPQILLASVVTQDNDNNLFFVTATVDFPGGKGYVHLCTGDDRNQIAELQKNGNFWTVNVQLSKGQHVLWLLAVDAQGVESWRDLGSIHALNELPASSGTASGSTETEGLANAIRDTILSAIFLVPVAIYVAYKKRKGLLKN
jgi:hypothetical protein